MGEFYNNVFKKLWSNNDIIMYSTYNEGKSVVAERFIRTLKNKLYKHTLRCQINEGGVLINGGGGGFQKLINGGGDFSKT